MKTGESKYFFVFKKNHLVTIITMNAKNYGCMPLFCFQVIQDRIGFFPANFVQRVHQNEKILRC